MGLERLCQCFNKDSNYDTDQFSSLFKKLEYLSGHNYKTGNDDSKSAVAFE